MRTEYYLFHVIGIAPRSRAKVCTQWRMSLIPRPFYSTDFDERLTFY